MILINSHVLGDSYPGDNYFYFVKQTTNCLLRLNLNALNILNVVELGLLKPY